MFTFPVGSLFALKQCILSGHLSNKIVYNENPFNFEHVNLSNIYVHLDGQSDTVPSLDPDFSNNLYIMCYSFMFRGVCKVNTDEDFNVPRTAYDNGYKLYRFNLATD